MRMVVCMVRVRLRLFALIAWMVLLMATPAWVSAAHHSSAPGHIGAEQVGDAGGLLGANILSNPSFEDPVGSDPYSVSGGWLANNYFNYDVCAGGSCGNPYTNFYGSATTYPIVSPDRNTAHSGSQSVLMTKTNGGAEPMLIGSFNAEGPRTYAFSMWVKTSGSASKVRARVGYVDDFYFKDTWTVPGDGVWHQVMGSEYFPQSQTGVQLGIRAATNGQAVNFDDVSLRQLPFNIYPAGLGQEQVGQNQASFHIQAVRDVPAGLTLSMNVTNPDGSVAPASAVTLPAISAGTTYTASVPYQTNSAGTYALDPSISSNGQSIYHVDTLQGNDPYVGDTEPAGYPNLLFTLKPGLSTTLVEPHYRAAIYQTDPVQSVVIGGLLAIPAGESLANARVTGQIAAADGSVVATSSIGSLSDPSFQLSFPASSLPAAHTDTGNGYLADSYTVKITVSTSSGTYTSTQSFRKLGPSPDCNGSSCVESVRNAHNLVQVNGVPFYARGLYRADDEQSLDVSHFNLSLWDPTFPHRLPPPGAIPYDKEFRAGVRYIVQLAPSNPVNPYTREAFKGGAVCKYDYTEPVTCMDTYLQTMLDLTRNNPQVIGYAFEDEYLYDRYIQHAYDYVVAHDPYRFMYETAHIPFDYVNIWKAADVVAVDPYPIVPQIALGAIEVSRQLDAARQSFGNKAALWLVPQIFAGYPAWVPPSIGQEQAMFYLGMLHGATGEYGYATYSGEIYPMPSDCAQWPGVAGVETVGGSYLLHWHVWCTDLWPAYIDLSRQSQFLVPILTYGIDTASAWTVGDGSPTGIDWQIRRYNGSTYLIAVNTDSQAYTMTFKPPVGSVQDDLTAGRYQTLFGEDSGITVKDGAISVHFAPYQPRVIQIIGGSSH